jgi:hypothetical protein
MTTRNICAHCGRAALLLAGAAAGLLLSCSEALSPQPIDQYRLVVPTLTAVYQADSGYVRLTWTPPNGSFSHYRIYRTTEVDTVGNADTSTLVSDLRRANVPSAATSFNDLPEPSDGVYYYGIRAVRVDGADTVEGALSPLDSRGAVSLVQCTVGVNVHFNINQSDVFTLTRECSLYVVDPGHLLTTVRFTQYRRGGVAAVDTIARDTYGQLRDLIRSGFLSSTSAASTSDTGSPDFGAADTANQTTPVYLPDDAGQRFPWKLLPGAGRKAVFVEFTYRDGHKDTVVDFIQTQPHKVEVVFRTPMGSFGSLRKDTTELTNPLDSAGGAKSKISIFYTSTFDFSVKVFGDSSIDPDFDVWLITSTNNEYIHRGKFKLATINWLMTRPVGYQLTGKGTLHNSDAVYPLQLNGSNAEGNLALSALKMGNMSAFTADTTGSFATMYTMFSNLRAAAQTTVGRKGFLFVARFKETYFGGAFVVVYGYDANNNELFRTYRDVYIPVAQVMNLLNKNPDRLPNNAVVRAPFNFALDSVSVFDRGLAKITDVKLVIARLPVDSTGRGIPTPPGITYNQILSFSNSVFPFQVEKPDTMLTKVRWDNIDPRLWTTGDYLVGVVVQDDKGNTGFANVIDENKSAQPNPWRINVRTSY